jgi:hypothetical protein
MQRLIWNLGDGQPLQGPVPEPVRVRSHPPFCGRFADRLAGGFGTQATTPAVSLSFKNLYFRRISPPRILLDSDLSIGPQLNIWYAYMRCEGNPKTHCCKVKVRI